MKNLVVSKIILVLFSSVLLSFSLRPWGLGALALVALIPGLLALFSETSFWKAALYVYLIALGGVFVALEGLAVELPFVFVVGVIVYPITFAFVGLAMGLGKTQFGNAALWFFPLGWVAVEFLISQRWLFGMWANPIMAIGYTQFDTPFLQAAALSGVTGVSLMVVCTNTALAWLLATKKVMPTIVFVLMGILVLVFPMQNISAKGKPFTVGIAQGYIPSLEYTIADFDVTTQKQIAARYKTLLAQLKTQKPDLVILPETAFGGWQVAPEQNQLMLDTLSATPLALVGAKVSYGKQNGHNAILEYQREARRFREVYSKQIPIPLTEGGYIPGRNTGLTRLGGVLFGLGICWENVFAMLARNAVNAGAEVLVYQNSLLWAGKTATPILHLHISAFRAVETGRDVIHATAGGPSAVIRADGKITAVSPRTTETILMGEVQPRTGTTPYLVLGDWVGMVCALSWLLMVFGSIWRSKAAKT